MFGLGSRFDKHPEFSPPDRPHQERLPVLRRDPNSDKLAEDYKAVAHTPALMRVDRLFRMLLIVRASPSTAPFFAAVDDRQPQPWEHTHHR